MRILPKTDRIVQNAMFELCAWYFVLCFGEANLDKSQNRNAVASGPNMRATILDWGEPDATAFRF